jgi:hypothetical protein
MGNNLAVNCLVGYRTVQRKTDNGDQTIVYRTICASDAL